MTTLLRPSYGRNYRTIESALEDVANGEDFTLPCGSVCTIHEFHELPSGPIVLMYNTEEGDEIEVQDIVPAT
jgi:hypothetical protein